MHTLPRPLLYLLLLLSLIPLTTLFHHNDLGRWDFNRNAMAAPDEFSYLLLARNLLEHHGISTLHTVGRDTFYPPGYPALLAAWSSLTGLTIFRVHLLNTLLVCCATPIVFFFSKRLLALLSESTHPRLRAEPAANDTLALLIAALFATNWHVLEGALFVFSEPAFMLTTFAWLALGLRWRNWPTSLPQTLALTVLAIAAWSIRGAGLVCLPAMLANILLVAFTRSRNFPQLAIGNRISAIRPLLRSFSVVIALALIYQIAITKLSPEKSLASVNASDNSYALQLLRGITKNNTLHTPAQLSWRILTLAFSHLDDFAQSFTPWFREAPAWLFLNVIGKIFAVLALAGWLYRLLHLRTSPSRFLELYIAFYIALYLLWPFNMTRFWAPILPVMLVYAVDALRQFLQSPPDLPLFRPRVAAPILLSLLLLLSGQELWLQLGNYERRLNYVSDALAASAHTIVHHSPNPADTIVAVAGTSEHFIFAWYLPRPYLPRSPEPHLPDGSRESVEHMLLRSLHELDTTPTKRLFIASYFTEPDYRDVFQNLRRSDPALLARFDIHRIFQKEIITTVWEVSPKPAPASFP
ncbi:MAG: hypothetical protein ACTHN5_06880 [Phycisphaerae bacterium]